MIALDTNVFVYAVGRGEPEKCARAVAVLRRTAPASSLVALQVLSEFLNVCRQKHVLDVQAARTRVAEWVAVYKFVSTRPEDILAASRLSERYDLQVFDALICAVSRAADATVLLSEDMHDGRDMDGLVVLNPFNPANDARIEAALG